MIDVTTNKPAKSWIMQRLDEPSTYAGIGVVLAAIAPVIEGAAQAASWPERIVIILAGLAGIIKSETKS
jgi:hypothetical protein